MVVYMLQSRLTKTFPHLFCFSDYDSHLGQTLSAAEFNSNTHAHVPSMLSQHQSVYPPAISFPVTCHVENCTESFNSGHSLSKHMMCAHPGRPPFICTLCGKGFFSDSGLYKHMYVHRGKTFACPVCGKMFTHKFNMKKHLSSLHNINFV